MAERGQRVLVSRDTIFEVGDHNFTCSCEHFTVHLLYHRYSRVGRVVLVHWESSRRIERSRFEPSSPPRHVVELYDIVTSQDLQMKPIMFMYTDSGPDQKLTYLSIHLALVLLFLKLDLDFLCLPYRSISFVKKPSGKNNVHFEF